MRVMHLDGALFVAQQIMQPVMGCGRAVAVGHMQQYGAQPSNCCGRLMLPLLGAPSIEGRARIMNNADQLHLCGCSLLDGICGDTHKSSINSSLPGHARETNWLPDLPLVFTL